MKNIFYIFILIIGLNFTTQAQNKSAINGNVQAKFLKAYPIPATTQINFDFLSGYDKSITLEIYNFTGKKVFELKSPSIKTSVSLAEFTRGFYFYQLRDKNGRIVETTRFLVLK